jgi:transcriptional regulator with XRE-family HTH domain
MANRQRLVTMGTRRGERISAEFGETIRDARVGLGLTQRELGRLVRISDSHIGRIEHAMPPYVDFIEASKLAQVLGLELSVRCFATGAAVRDVGHVRLLTGLCEQTPLVRWSLEHTIPIPGDLRAWDAHAVIDGVGIGVAAETRLRDVQALLRREHAKMRDSDVELLILLVLGSRANRETLAAIRESLRTDLPLDSREILAALRAGERPRASGIVLL